MELKSHEERSVCSSRYFIGHSQAKVLVTYLKVVLAVGYDGLNQNPRT